MHSISGWPYAVVVHEYTDFSDTASGWATCDELSTTLPRVTVIGSETDDDLHASTQADVRPESTDKRLGFMRRVHLFRPGALHASIVISCVVAAKAFTMSYAALHNLA